MFTACCHITPGASCTFRRTGHTGPPPSIKRAAIGRPFSRGQQAVVSQRRRQTRSPRTTTLLTYAQKRPDFRAPRFGEQPWQYALNLLEDQLQAFPSAQRVIRFVREQPFLSIAIGATLAAGISMTIASVVLPAVFVAVGAVTLFPLFAFVFTAVAFSLGVAAVALFGAISGTILFASGSKIALISATILPAAAALAAGGVAVAIATQIGSKLSVRDVDDRRDAPSDGAGGRESAVREPSGTRGTAAGDAKGEEPVDVEARLAADELRAFDDRLLGSDSSQWSVAEVGIWLEKSGFGSYVRSFAAQDVDGRVLLSLGIDDLRDAGLGVSSFGERKRLSMAIEELLSKRKTTGRS